MLVTDWPGKISGVNCQSDSCDGCVMFQLCRMCLRLAGWMPMVIWESLTAYSIYGDNYICIDHLQHTEAEVVVEQMGSFEEDGALLITVMIHVQPFRNYLLERTA